MTISGEGGAARAAGHEGPWGANHAIVVGFDGSDVARRALVRAGQLARPDGRVIAVVAAPLLAQLSDDPTLPQIELLTEAAQLLAPFGVEVEALAAPLEPAHALYHAVRTWAAHVVVVGSRGRGRAARTALGSVSAELLEHAPCDVLVVRSDGGTEDPARAWPLSVLVAFDASPSAPLALDHALRLVGPGGRVLVGLALPVRGRRRRGMGGDLLSAELARLADQRLEIVDLPGERVAAVAAAAEERDIDLVVVPSDEHGPILRALRGSISRSLVHRSGRDVLVVQPASAAAE